MNEIALNCTPRLFAPVLSWLSVLTLMSVPVLTSAAVCWGLEYLLPAPVTLVVVGLMVDADLELPILGEPLLPDRVAALLSGPLAELLARLLADGVLAWPLDDEELPLDEEELSPDDEEPSDPALSAWATPDPPASAAPTPNVTAPAPSHAYRSR